MSDIFILALFISKSSLWLADVYAIICLSRSKHNSSCSYEGVTLEYPGGHVPLGCVLVFVGRFVVLSHCGAKTSVQRFFVSGGVVEEAGLGICSTNRADMCPSMLGNRSAVG